MKFGKVLVLVTGSQSDSLAVSNASSLVMEHRGHLLILHVILMERSLHLDAEVPDKFRRGEDILRIAENMVTAPHITIEAELVQAREIGSAVVHEASARNMEATIIVAPPEEYLTHSTTPDISYILQYAPGHVFLLREPLN
tara:strand:+ start:45 stop:467 length:423 start_codon:yes stop_codon:yes gene_type:complete